MLWVLWDIFLPVLAAFLVGLFSGWLFWRWRRSRIDADTLAALRRNATRLKADADDLRAHNAELSDRLQAASVSSRNPVSGKRNFPSSTGSNDGSLSNELVVAKKRIETLSAELKSSRLEVNQLKATKVKNENDKASPSDQRENRIRDLEARLLGANRRIADLETANKQRSANPQDPATPANSNINEQIAERDKMIETLQQSLAQYGDAKDVTTLTAELALRDNKIAALESLLDGTNQKNS